MTFSLRGAQAGALLDHTELEAHLGRYDLEPAGRADGPARRPEPVLCGSVEGRPRLTEPWFC
jgi:hypothetical protein